MSKSGPRKHKPKRRSSPSPAKPNSTAYDLASLKNYLAAKETLAQPKGEKSEQPEYAIPDVVIVVAKKEEYEFIQPLLPADVKPLLDPITHHSEADFDLSIDTESKLRVKLVRLGEAGEVRACAVLTRVLWKMALAHSQATSQAGQASNGNHVDKRALPKLLVNVGIAATMKDDVRLCDVIIAGHVTRYMEDQKCVDRPKKDGFTFKPRPDAHTRVDTATSDDIDHRISSDPKFLQQWKGECDSIALSVFGDHAKNQTLEKLGVTTASSNLRLLTKKIFSGPLLLDSSCFKSELKNLDGGCHALDMESGGFAWGWMALPIPDADKPKMVVIKGISDYGDGSKGDTDSGKSSAKPKLSKEEKEKKAAIANVGADDFRRIAMRRAWVTMISLLRAGLIT